MRSIRNRYNEKPIDLLPPNPSPGSDDEQVRAAIRAAEAAGAVAAKGDIADGACCFLFSALTICWPSDGVARCDRGCRCHGYGSAATGPKGLAVKQPEGSFRTSETHEGEREQALGVACGKQ